MNAKLSDIPKIAGFACSRIVPFFTLKELGRSEIWENSLDKFLIIAAPRTGSNMLVSMLNSHPEILCHYELFHWQKIYTAQGGKGGLSDLWKRNSNPSAFLQKIYSNGFGKKTVGFKIFPNHNPAVLKFLIKQSNVKKIILKRANYLETYVSHLLAKRNGAYMYKPGVSKAPVYVDERQFKSYVVRNEAFYRNMKEQLRASDQNFLEMEYLQIIDPAYVEKLLLFIGVDADQPIKPGTRKQNPEPLSERIANYGDLVGSLCGTEYGIYLS